MLKSLNVLYAEREDFTRESTTEALKFMSMKVKAVSNGEKAYKEYLKNRPDIIIVDIEIPVLGGLDLIKKIRKNDKETLIIVATAHTSTECFLKVVELNLVRYLLKPLSLSDIKDVLCTCIQSLEYRSEKINKYFNEKDYYNLKKQRLYVDDQIIKLDFHEKNFLELLLKNQNQVVTYSVLEEKVWKKNMSSAALRSLVRNLRKKLPADVIENVSKTGYKIVVKINN